MQPTPSDATRNEIEAAVENWRSIRAERLAAEKIADAIKSKELELKDFIIAAMTTQRYEGIVREGRQTYVRTSQVPMASDRLQFENYIRETGALELLQFRPASGALKERLESGIEVPGIVWVDVFDLGDKRA